MPIRDHTSAPSRFELRRATRRVGVMRSDDLRRVKLVAAALLLELSAGVERIEADEAQRHGDAPIQFNRDIRPLLSNNCFQCHGPDEGERQTDMRLDTRQGLLAATTDGEGIVVPRKPEKSELFQRVTAADPNVRMPPPDSGKELTPAEIARLRRWIASGAEVQDHWAYLPVVRPALPTVNDPAWARGAIDRFVLSRLELEALAPSAPAVRRTLVRRLTFDLTGLPPTLAEVRDFLSDDSPHAYAKVVDRLLASPHFGERLATHWLDLVRYADSVGYHGDQPHAASPYRDYVINAFNADKPFDVFTIEQLAGDLVTAPTIEQRIASGYNRLIMTTEEGGAQPKEYLAKYSADRVRTTASVWLGSTLACAECHNHKFDPFTMRDFYRFAAFFSDLDERGVYGGRGYRPPEIFVPTLEQAQELEALTRELEHATEALQRSLPEKMPPDLERVFARAAHRRSSKQRQAVERFSRELPPAAAQLLAAREDVLTRKQKHEEIIRKCMISVRAETPRMTRVLPRGNWLDESGEVVTAAVPSFLGRLDLGGRQATRLDLARWLVADDQPLTARVVVNRLWKLFFGNGLSSVLDDLGAQGEWPTHPELLDWLAAEFVASGWDLKHMIRLMVHSATYRQSSIPRPDLLARDPFNRLYARQSRWRLEAESIRDTALDVSGLLARRLGGAGAKPYQPQGYYAHLNFPTRVYESDRGANQYRRGVYTHWQRTFLHPMLLAFDAPAREECTATRPISNTPKAALVLLNDPSFVEAARVFAARILARPADDAKARIRWAWERTLARPPSAHELELIGTLYERHRRHYEAHPEAAQQLVSVGLAALQESTDSGELAAWTSVARALFNLSETITRN